MFGSGENPLLGCRELSFAMSLLGGKGGGISLELLL